MGSGGSGGGWWLWRLQHWYRCYMQHWQQQHESVTNADYRSAGNLGRGVADVGIGLHCSSQPRAPISKRHLGGRRGRIAAAHATSLATSWAASLAARLRHQQLHALRDRGAWNPPDSINKYCDTSCEGEQQWQLDNGWGTA
jgi:hypothetical protein